MGWPITAREVPLVRDELMHSLMGAAGTAIARTEIRRARGVMVMRGLPDEDYMTLREYIDTELTVLGTSTLYWVHPDMCAILRAAVESLPSTELPIEYLPSLRGFVVLGQAIPGTDSEDPSNHNLTVSAFGWTPAKDDRTGDEARFLRIRTWGDLDAQDPTHQVRNIIQSRLYTLGVSAWTIGLPWTDPGIYASGPQQMRTSVMEDRRLLAAFSLLLRQPLSVTSERQPNNAERKQALRRKSKPSPVTLIELRAKSRPKVEAGEGREVQWSHRWPVRAHWVNQWHPSSGTHELILRGPFVKGPADKPLVVKDTVKVWVR